MALYHDERPEHIAETAILKPTKHVPIPRDRMWRKRTPKTHPSKGGKYWLSTEGIKKPCPIAAPIKRARKIKPLPRPENPLPYFTERSEPFVMYSRAEFEQDIAGIEELRALLRQEFIRSEQADQPYLDGLKFKKLDDDLLKEITKCERRLGATQGIIQQAKAAAKLRIPTPKQATSERWRRIGSNPDIAKGFEQMNFKVRKIEAGKAKSHYYQVLMGGYRKGKHA